MAGRLLDADEQALWHSVTASVRPLGRRAVRRGAAAAEEPGIALPDPPPPRASQPRPAPAAAGRATPGETLDGGWDRRLSRGLVAPDRTVDLHGHTLGSAHNALDHALDRAIGEGARLILLVTGRPPRAEDRGAAGPRRGAIRAAVGDWLAASRHAGRIAAIRNAHPRHGGGGALYIVLRRSRTG